MDAATSKTWIDVVYVIAAGVPAAVIALIGLKSARVANAKIDTNTAITKETQEKVNGRMDQLLSSSQEVAHARGRATGILEQQHLQTMFAKDIIKNSTEKTNKMVRLIDAISGAGSTLDVLVIEDNEIDSQVLCRMLARFNLRCECAVTASDALNKLMNKSFGAIFADLDLQCPMSLEGKSIQNFINNAPTTPLFVVTGYANKIVVEGMKLIGVIATIEKPATEENLGEVFNNLSNLGL